MVVLSLHYCGPKLNDLSFRLHREVWRGMESNRSAMRETDGQLEPTMQVQVALAGSSQVAVAVKRF